MAFLFVSTQAREASSSVQVREGSGTGEGDEGPTETAGSRPPAAPERFEEAAAATPPKEAS